MSKSHSFVVIVVVVFHVFLVSFLSESFLARWKPKPVLDWHDIQDIFVTTVALTYMTI